jgi:hypothetical protein
VVEAKARVGKIFATRCTEVELIAWRLATFGCCVSALALPSRAVAQKLFAGTITYDLDAQTAQAQIVVSARGRKIRQELHRADEPEVARDNFFIIDYDRGEIVSVFPAIQRYMVVSFKKLRGAIGVRDTSSENAEREGLGEIVATERRDTVAGVGCDVYTFKNASDEEWCITTALGGLLSLQEQPGSGASGESQVMLPTNLATTVLLRSFKQGALVLRMQTTDKGGRPISLVATKIDRSPPPERRLAIPSGYLEVENSLIFKP